MAAQSGPDHPLTVEGSTVVTVEVSGIALLTTQAGAIGPGRAGDSTTVLDPAPAPAIVPSGAQWVQDVAAELKEVASTR